MNRLTNITKFLISLKKAQKIQKASKQFFIIYNMSHKKSHPQR